MFSEDVLWHHLHPEHWARLVGDLRKAAGLDRNTLFVVRDGTRVVQTVLDGRAAQAATSGGTITPSEGLDLDGVPRIRDLDDLARLARAVNAEQAVCLQQGALDRVFAELGRKIEHRDDYGLQLHVLYEAVRRELGTGLLFWPRRRLPAVPYPLARRLGEFLLPAGRSFVLVVFQPDGEVWTSLVLGTDAGRLREIATVEVLGEAPEGLKQLDWRRRIDWYLRQAACTSGKPALGLFCTRIFWDRLCAGPRRARIVRAGVARGEAVLEPFVLRYRLAAAAATLAEEFLHWDKRRRGGRT